MLEQALLQGRALLLLEFPSRLNGNELLLRDFFQKHFDHTPASQIKAIQFSPSTNNKNNNNSDGGGGSSLLESTCACCEVIVEFFDSEGVKLVLSRILQHELLEREEKTCLELRRGFIYFGRDRLLVEGVVHLQQAHQPKAQNVSDVDTTVASFTSTAASDGNDDKEDVSDRRKKNTARKLLTECGEKQGGVEESDGDYVDYHHAIVQHHNDNKGDVNDGSFCSVTKSNESLKQQTHSADGANAVVLCMTFVCTFDRHDHGKKSELYGDDNNFCITPHVIYQLLRDVCFVRKVVMISRDSSGVVDGNNTKQRTVRALVEVGNKDDAKSIVTFFHGTTLELAVDFGTNSEKKKKEEVVVVEYRFNVYVRFNDDSHTRRQLSVHVNTNKALSVTPLNLAMMGPVFQRHKFLCGISENDAVGQQNTVWGNGLGHEAKVYKEEISFNNTNNKKRVNGNHDNVYSNINNNINDKNSNEIISGSGKNYGLADCERSRGKRQRRYSKECPEEREDLSKCRRHGHNKHDSYRHHRYHNHHNNIDGGGGGNNQTPTASCEVLRCSETTANNNVFNNSCQQWKEWQQQQQQHQQQQQQQSVCYFLSHDLRYVGCNTAVTSPMTNERPLPPGWRAVYSKEYQRVYYVYRDPVTGVETSSWEPILVS